MNVVFWTGIQTHLSTKYGGFDWLNYSKLSWQYWCKKNNVTFVAFEEPYADIDKHRANWQKAIHCWDILDERGLDPDNVFLVDASSMVKWDAPNIFEQIDERLTGWPDLDNLKWIYQSIEGYKSFFDYEFDNTKYINSGVDYFQQISPPFNYWLQMNGVEVNTSLPVTWKLTHLHRKQMLGHNWQLNDDNMPFFIKHGYLWFFTGFEKMQRNRVMSDVWKLIGHNYEA